ncbi:VCBS domain-containing protein, partial [Tenacibaculum geojense]
MNLSVANTTENLVELSKEIVLPNKKLVKSNNKGKSVNTASHIHKDNYIVKDNLVSNNFNSYSYSLFAAPVVDLNTGLGGINSVSIGEPVANTEYTINNASVTSDTGFIKSAQIVVSGVVDPTEFTQINNADGNTNGGAPVIYTFGSAGTDQTFFFLYGTTIVRIAQTGLTTFDIVAVDGVATNTPVLMPTSVMELILNDFGFGTNTIPFAKGYTFYAVTVTDEADLVSTTAFDIIGSRLNSETPYAVDDSFSVFANNTGTIAGDITTNDNELDPNYPHQILDINLYTSAIGTSYSTLYGSITMQANGTFTYDVDETNLTVRGLRAGESIQDIFSYTLTDGIAVQDTGILSINIQGVDEPPVAQDNLDAVTVNVQNTATGNIITDNGPGGIDAVDRGLSQLIWENVFANGAQPAAQPQPITINGIDLTFTNDTDPDMGPTGFNQTVQSTLVNGGHTGYFLFNIDPTAQPAPTSSTDLVITFSEPVFNLGFLLVDTDYSQNNVWQDQFTVIGTLGGNASTFNYITTQAVVDTGNPTFYGTGSAPESEATGNINVFFTQPIDQLRIQYNYGPDVTVPDPGGQIGGVSDIYWQDQSSVAITELGTNATNANAANVGVVYTGTYGSITVNADGTYTYNVDTSNTDVSNLLIGDTLTDVFYYTLTDGSGTDSANLIITINGTACSVSAPSSTENLCINTALNPITHTTAGATGISNDGVSGANGLPAGVSATWASNTITISGTPTVDGVFNYSIPLTGGCTSGGNATGTITVNAVPTAGLSSSDADNTICAGDN